MWQREWVMVRHKVSQLEWSRMREAVGEAPTVPALLTGVSQLSTAMLCVALEFEILQDMK